jgi:thioredoxin 1
MKSLLRVFLLIALGGIILSIPSSPCRDCGALHAQDQNNHATASGTSASVTAAVTEPAAPAADPAAPPASDTAVSPTGASETMTTTEMATASATPATAPAITGPLPKLVDLGAKKCIPCKKMAPILEEAKKLYAGIAEVEFIDVWENRDAGSTYGVRTIPTQIFYDRDGKEVFRHEGFMPMEDIQKQFEALGAKLEKKQ